jgi:hypothetical protein
LNQVIQPNNQKGALYSTHIIPKNWIPTYV